MRLDEIGKKIKELRKAKGLTQAELANIANLSRVTVGKLERGGVSLISIKTLDLILDAVGYQIDFSRKINFGLPTLDELIK